jgi:hypothetical protein
MMNQYKTKTTCENCREAYEMMRKTDPPCERCFPGVDENNVEAMNVYQMCSVSENGISAADIIEVCKAIEVKDQQEVFLKVSELTRTLHSLREAP